MIRKKLIVKKPIFKKAWFWIALSFVFFIFIALGLFLFLPQFHLKIIEIEGDLVADREKIENFTRSFFSNNFFLKPHLFLRSKKSFEAEFLKNFPSIQEIKVKRVFPSKLVIKIQKRKESFLFCKRERECYFIDENGIIFEKLKEEGSGLPKIEFSEQNKNFTLGEKILSEEEIKHFLEIRQILKKKEISIEKILVLPERIEIFTSGNFKIFFDFKKDIFIQLAKLEIFLEKEIERWESLEYIDLRFEDQIFFKPKT